MLKKITILFITITLASCANIKDKMPKQKACTGENATLADVFCKKK